MTQRNKGFLRLVATIVIALIILGYFGYDIREILASPKVKENLQYAWGLAKTAAAFVWDYTLIAWDSIENSLREMLRYAKEQFRK